MKIHKETRNKKLIEDLSASKLSSYEKLIKIETS